MDKRDKREKSKIIVPIICLLMSIGFWVYVTNVEVKIRSTEITKVPVELINTEALTSSKLAISPEQELFVNLKVEGSTSDINKIKKSDFKVQVDMSEYAWKKGENKIPVAIVDYPITISIKNNNMLTVGIKLEDLVEKTLTVESKLKIMPREGYFVAEPKITPTEVKVLGAESVVNKVASLAIMGEQKDIFEDVSITSPIKALDGVGNEISGVSLSEKNANVLIKVSKGKLVNVKVKTSGDLQNGSKLRSIELNKSAVELIGPKEVLDKISEVHTSNLDLSKVTDSRDNSLSIIVPEGVEIRSEDKTVIAKVVLESKITKDFDVKYSIKGKAQGFNVKPKTDITKVTISGFPEDISVLKVENILAEINIDNIKAEGTFEQEPKVTFTVPVNSIQVQSVSKISVDVSKEKVAKIETTTSTN